MNANTGRYLILGGMLLVAMGIAIYFFHDKLKWLGHLPGDIRVEKENFQFYFPITTMIVLSIFVSMLVYFVKKLL